MARFNEHKLPLSFEGRGFNDVERDSENRAAGKLFRGKQVLINLLAVGLFSY